MDEDEVDDVVLEEVELAVEEDEDDAVDVADDVESVLEAVVVADSEDEVAVVEVASEVEVVVAEVDVDDDSSVVVVSRFSICTSLSSMTTSSTSPPPSESPPSLPWHRADAHPASTCACSRVHPAWTRQPFKCASSAPVCAMQPATRAASPQVIWEATLSLWQGLILWW